VIKRTMSVLAKVICEITLQGLKVIWVFLDRELATAVPSSWNSWNCTFNTTSSLPAALLKVSTLWLSKDTYLGTFVMPPVFGAPAGAKLEDSTQVWVDYI